MEIIPLPEQRFTLDAPLASALGSMLYKQVGLQGTTTWDISNLSIQQFSVQAITHYREASLSGALENLRSIVAPYYKEKHRIIIPTPAIAEFLMKIPSHEQPGVIEVVDSQFVLAPFDTAASFHFTRIWSQARTRIANHAEPKRNEIKFDSMILAIAVSNRANVLYTEDHHLMLIRSYLWAILQRLCQMRWLNGFAFG